MNMIQTTNQSESSQQTIKELLISQEVPNQSKNAIRKLMDQYRNEDSKEIADEEIAKRVLDELNKNPVLFLTSKNPEKQKVLTFYEKEKKWLIDIISTIFSTETSLLENESNWLSQEQKQKISWELKNQLEYLKSYCESYSNLWLSFNDTLFSLEWYIPHFNEFKALYKDSNQQSDISSLLQAHIASESNKNHLAVQDTEYKIYFTRQVVAGLLRSEVSDKDKVGNLISASYGENFVINNEIQQKLKNEHITLMDMTLDMIDLEETDVKILLYAMMVKKDTWVQEHPIPSELYTVSWNDINTLELTEKGVQYFQTAIQWWLQFHCKELYNKNSEDTDIPWLENKIVFANSRSVVNFYLQEHENPYIQEHKSDLLATARCLIHHARWSQKPIDQTLLEGKSYPFEAFDNKEKRKQSTDNFLQQEWANLPLQDNYWNSIKPTFDSINNIRHNEDITIAWAKWRFIWRGKSFESEVRKMRNSPQYRHIESIHDTIANRFEIYPTGNPEQDRRNIIIVHKTLYHHFLSAGKPKTPPIKIKWKQLKAAYNESYKETEAQANSRETSEQGARETAIDSALQKENSNAKTADSYQEAKIHSLAGVEYQIITAETDKYGPNNHAIYDPKKRVDDRIRIEWSINPELVRHICDTELHKNIEDYSIPYTQKAYPWCTNKIQIKAAILLYINKTLRQYILNWYNIHESINKVISDIQQESITFQSVYNSLSNKKEDLEATIERNTNQLLEIMYLESTKDLSYSKIDNKFHSLKADKRLMESYTNCYDMYKKTKNTPETLT